MSGSENNFANQVPYHVEVMALTMRAMDADDYEDRVASLDMLKSKIATSKNPLGLMWGILGEPLTKDRLTQEASFDLHALAAEDPADNRACLAHALRAIATIGAIPDLMDNKNPEGVTFAEEAAFFARTILLQVAGDSWGGEQFRTYYPAAIGDAVKILAQTSDMMPSLMQRNVDVLLESLDIATENQSRKENRNNKTWSSFTKVLSGKICNQAQAFVAIAEKGGDQDALQALQDRVTKLSGLDSEKYAGGILCAPNHETARDGLRGLLNLWKKGVAVDSNRAQDVFTALEDSLHDNHFNAPRITHPVLIETCVFLASREASYAKQADDLLKTLLKMPKKGAYAMECDSILGDYIRNQMAQSAKGSPQNLALA